LAPTKVGDLVSLWNKNWKFAENFSGNEEISLFFFVPLHDHSYPQRAILLAYGFVELEKYLSFQLLRKLILKALSSSKSPFLHSEHLEITILPENLDNVFVFLNVSWEGVGLASIFEDDSCEKVDQVDFAISLSFEDIGLVLYKLPSSIGVNAFINLLYHFCYLLQIGLKIIDHRVYVCVFGSVEVFKVVVYDLSCFLMLDDWGIEVADAGP
jgi:hypothetical protein